MPALIPITFFGRGYLFRDEFTTAQAAPITTPRVCEPGPGGLTFAAPAGASIAAGALTITGDAPSQQFFTATAGIALKAQASGSWTMQHDGQYYAGDDGLYSVGFYVPTVLSQPACIVRRVAGAFYISGGTTLSYITKRVLGSRQIQIGSRVGSATFQYVRVALLQAGFQTDYGIATNYSAAPNSGDQLAHVADGLADIVWTAATGGVLEFDVRRTDADNRWIVRCDEAGNTVKLIERNAGVETERSSASITINNATAYHLLVTMTGNTIRSYLNDNVCNSYTLASFNNTATTGAVSITAGAIANFATWPRTLSAEQQAEIARM